MLNSNILRGINNLLIIFHPLLALNRKEFEEHKIGHLVTVRCRDVCKEGFELHQVADAGQCKRASWKRNYNIL